MVDVFILALMGGTPGGSPSGSVSREPIPPKQLRTPLYGAVRARKRYWLNVGLMLVVP